MATQKPSFIFVTSVLSLITGIAHTTPVEATDETSLLQIPSISADPSRYIDPDFPSFSFDEASFVNYALNNDGTPNLFSQNLVDSIFSRTGGKPIIRLGGTSADYARYLANQTKPVLPSAKVDEASDIGHTTLGPSYWDIAARGFPSARYVVQVPLANADMAESVRWAMAATSSLGLSRIHAFATGNEPDMYPAHGLGPPQWQGPQGNGTYVANFLNYADAISTALGLPRGTRMFQALDTASHPTDPQQDVFALSLPSVFQRGLDNHHEVKTIARHYYQMEETETSADLADGLMNHGAITSRLDVYRDDLEFLASRGTNATSKIPFVLSEVGSSIKGKKKKHAATVAAGYQATLGSALWRVDVQLYGLSLGISRFHFQQALNGGSNMWFPVRAGNVSAQVLANFYAQPFVADFVGATGTAQVRHVPLEPNVASYVAYEGGAPKRVAIVNLKYWSKCLSRGTARAAQKVHVEVPGGVRRVKVVHLTSGKGAGAKANTITYGGSQWTYENLGKEVTGARSDGDVINVEGGSVIVPVQASEAVILHLL